MTILSIYNEQVSAELGEFLLQIKPNVDNYYKAKETAQKERMMIIGQCVQYREQFPQRSADHRLLSQAMNSEWSSDVIKKQTQAYREFLNLKGSGVPEYERLADASNPSQLMALGRGKDTGLAYEAAQHLKKTGEVPSQGKLEQRLRGYVTPKFETRSAVRHHSTDKDAQTTQTQHQREAPTQPVTLTPTISPEKQHELNEFSRLGITDLNRQDHIRRLVANENLPYIDSIKVANFWYTLSQEEMLKVIRQRIEKDRVFETKVRECLNNYVTDVVAEVVADEVPHTLDNAIHDGVRWRR